MGAGWLDDAPHIPWCDIRKPGAQGAVKVWMREGLGTFLRTRRVLPGQVSPW